MTSVNQPEGLATADPQDPLPESNWIPRRWFSFGALIGGGLLILYAIKVQAPASVIIALIVFEGWLATLYLVAPSAEQAVKMIQAGASLRAGVSFSSSSKADASRGTVESTATATAPAVPATPTPAIDPKAGPED